MDEIHLPQGYSHFEEAVYFLPLSSQKFLVLILSTLEGWKAESTLEPPCGFEHGSLGLGIQRLKTTRPLCHEFTPLKKLEPPLFYPSHGTPVIIELFNYKKKVTKLFNCLAQQNNYAMFIYRGTAVIFYLKCHHTKIVVFKYWCFIQLAHTYHVNTS